MKFKKVLAVLLVAVMLLSVMPFTAFAAPPSSGDSGIGTGVTITADEVSETISLAYGPLSAISGTHYTVSADNLVGESAVTINDMHPMTINARKGETITKVVLTYSRVDDKNTLSASAGTFDGDATFSNINAQQVTISSWDNVDISDVTVYFEGDLNNPTVTLTGGANAKSSGGLSTQSYLPGAMDTVTYTALADATFPEFEAYTLNGVTVERTSDTAVTVSGTPTANTAITIPDAESSSKIVTWNSSLINDYIGDKVSKESSYSDTANGITLTNSEGEVAYFGNSYLETYDATLIFSTATGKFTSIEIEANKIYDGGNWTKDENILKWNGTPSESVSLTGDVFIMGLSSITFVIEPNTYTVTWNNADGTVLETDTDVKAGTIPTYDGATPTKATDEKYMYFFSGWSPEVTAVTGDITYTAQFNKQVVGLYLQEGDVVDKDETIRFPIVTRGNNFSGHVLKVYLDGELVKSVEVQDASSIEPDRYYTTTQKCIVSRFSKQASWPTARNTIYLTSLHTVTWQNEDGTVLETDTDVEEGTTPTYNGATPTKANDTYYTYTFSGWSPEVEAVGGDATYTAQFTATAKTFTVFAKTLTGKTVFVYDVTGETTAAQIKEMLVEETGIPAAQQRLIFAGSEMANDKTLADYNIQKESTIHCVPVNYTVTWLNYDGSELASEPVGYGVTPEYTGETPTKPDDAQYTYTFSGWTPEVTAVTGDVTYTAQFEATAKSTADNGYNLTLDDGINVNFLIDTDFYGAEDGYIEYEYIKSSTTESAERESGSIDVADLPTYSGGNVYDGDSRLTLKAAPAQIAEDYIIRVYDKDGELKNTLTVSIADYCEKMQDNATYGELMTALLNYGQLANEYFGYAAKVEGDYEVPHTENYKAALSAEEIAALDSLATASIVNQGSAQVTGVSYIAQLKPEFKFYFTGTSATEAEVSGGLSAVVEKTTEGSTVKVTGLNASDFDKTFTVTMDGTVLEYNGYAYLKAAMNSAALKDLAQGIFRYAQAADKTFN